MMHRRTFLESLAALTAGLAVPRSAAAGARDRISELLPQRRLGSTGQSVTMLGLGGAHVGRMSERDAEATIEAAIDGGIRFFDSAESYNNGGSERYLGRFLSPRYRDAVYLMTKTGAKTGEEAQRDLDDSLKRMNTDYLDLWQVHAIGSPEDVDARIEAGVLDVFERAKASGRVRHIGFTGHRVPEAHLRMLERTDIFETVQMPVNLADPSYRSFIRNVMPVALERGMAVLAMKTLGNGGFFGGDRHFHHGPHPRVVPDRVSVRDAVHFAWSFPISTLITGPDNPEMLHEKIQLARSYDGMDEERRQALIARVADMAGRPVEFYKA